MDQDATMAQTIFWSVYNYLAPTAAIALTAAATWLAGMFRKKVKSDLAAGMLVRLTQTVCDAVQAVNQQMHEILGNAKRPDSPGGRRLTESEAKRLKSAAVELVKDQWGKQGLDELARVLGFGKSADGTAMRLLESLISTKVESAVRAAKRLLAD